MKIIYKIKFHPLFYITALLMLFTGYFKDFSLFLIIVMFHELGHVLAGLIFKWKIKSINVLPFGAITIFDEGLTKSLLEEFIISIMGPLFQIIIYNLLRLRYDVFFIHYSLLIFNLLPIIPLDGSKIISVILNLFFPFKKSLFVSIILSIVLVVLSFVSCFYHFNLVFIFVLLFLLVKVFNEFCSINYIMNRFFYEKYYLPKSYKRKKVINGKNINKMFKERSHIFKVGNNYYTEHEILRKRFDFKGKL